MFDPRKTQVFHPFEPKRESNGPVWAVVIIGPLVITMLIVLSPSAPAPVRQVPCDIISRGPVLPHDLLVLALEDGRCPDWCLEYVPDRMLDEAVAIEDARLNGDAR